MGAPGHGVPRLGPGASQFQHPAAPLRCRRHSYVTPVPMWAEVRCVEGRDPPGFTSAACHQNASPVLPSAKALGTRPVTWGLSLSPAVVAVSPPCKGRVPASLCSPGPLTSAGRGSQPCGRRPRLPRRAAPPPGAAQAPARPPAGPRTLWAQDSRRQRGRGPTGDTDPAWDPGCALQSSGRGTSHQCSELSAVGWGLGSGGGGLPGPRGLGHNLVRSHRP